MNQFNLNIDAVGQSSQQCSNYLTSLTLTFDTYEAPSADPSQLHKYAYAGSNPVTLFDPSGHSYVETLTVLTLAALIVTMSLVTLHSISRSPSGLVGNGNFVPITPSKLEVHYHSLRISGTPGGANAVFKLLAEFSKRDLSPVSADRDITGVGDVVEFDMKPIFYDAGQADFPVKVTKFDAQQHFLVVQTMARHPLAGYRYWGVVTLPNGDILIETFSVEHPFTWVDKAKLDAGGMKAMYGTWTTFLSDVARSAGGTVVADPTTAPNGKQIFGIDPYYSKVR